MTDVSPRARRAQLKSAVAGLLCLAGVPALARRRNSGRLAILMFHGVEGGPLSPPCDYVTDAATLRRELTYLRRHFRVLPLQEALQRLRAGTLPRCAAALTFDDGTRNLAIHAAPVLRELRLPAAVFLATGPMGTNEALWPDRLWIAFAHTTVPEIDLAQIGLGTRSLRTADDRDRTRDLVVQYLKRLPDTERIAAVQWLVGALGSECGAAGGPFEMLSWDDARALADDGLVSLYPHTVTHPILARCTDEKVEYEISESCRAVERETGCAPTIFAYPNGGAGDFDERAKAVLRRNGIPWALSTTRGFADRESDPLALPRIGIGPDPSLALFRLKVSGFDLRWLRLLAGKVVPRERPAVGAEVGASV
jgi:peptidoglycan/xylan/chitin deacetylase (PgdA/CDA1 family)